MAAVAIYLTGSAYADSWGAPKQFEAVSENKQFVATVKPSLTWKTPTLTVSRQESKRRKTIWRTELHNSVSPISVRVSDDGSSVITFDNWGSVGYGDDVVGIYGSEGLRANYSLRDFAPPPELDDPTLRVLSVETQRILRDRRGYENLFPHSTSSRQWRQNSFGFFLARGEDWMFCLWLDWDQRWVVWRMSDGGVEQAIPDLTTTISQEAGSRAHRILASDTWTEDSAGAMSFLGWRNEPEDRNLIEQCLRDPHFTAGGRYYVGGFYTFSASSRKRNLADRILSRSKGLPEKRDRHNRVHQLLGNIHGSLEFPQDLYKGFLRIYLIPSHIALNDWLEHFPEHCLIVELPDSRRQARIRGEFDFGRIVNWEMLGVSPGSYRVKVVWDRVRPWAEKSSVLCQPGPGDYESVESPVIEVVKGQTTEVEIECKTPAEPMPTPQPSSPATPKSPPTSPPPNSPKSATPASTSATAKPG